MDVAATLKSEIFRPGVTLLMPGILAAFPYPYIAIHYQKEIHRFITDHAALATFVGTLVAIGFGLLAQEFGSFYEAKVIDERMKARKGDHLVIWNNYLRLTLPPDLVARSYIHDQVLFLRLELNLAVAFVSFGVGVFWLYCATSTISGPAMGVVSCISVGASVFLLYLAHQSAKTLDDVRRVILKGIGPPPATMAADLVLELRQELAAMRADVAALKSSRQDPTH